MPVVQAGLKYFYEQDNSAGSIILHGKLKEAATVYKSNVHHGSTSDPSCLIWYN